MVSEKTSEEYIEYLEERNYDYHVVGKQHVDLKEALELLSAKYSVKKLLTDTGRILSNLLLEQGLVTEISLLIHPVIVGRESYNGFSNISKTISLKLKKAEFLDEGYIWLVYMVQK